MMDRKRYADGSRVYMILAEELGRVKVGFTTELGRRFWNLGTSAPCELRLLVSFAGTLEDEQRLHSLLDRDRVPGKKEWYFFSPRIRNIAADLMTSAMLFEDLRGIELVERSLAEFAAESADR